MKNLIPYRLFESVSDDAYEKWLKAKTEYDAKISELKSEYLEGVKQCMFELTDTFDHTSSVKLDKDFRPDSGGDLVANFKFEVKTEKIGEFFDILEELDDVVKSYISQYRRIQISQVLFIGGTSDENWASRREMSRIYKQNAYSIEDSRKRVEQYIKELQSRQLAGIVIHIEI